MRRKLITVFILTVAAVSLYYTNRLTMDYYSRNFYNVQITTDKTEITLSKSEESATFDVSLINNSRKFITSADNVFLAYHIVDANGADIFYEGARHNIPDIRPFNKQEAIPMTVLNLDRPGEYIVQLDLVEEGVTWFSMKGNPMREIKLTITE